MIGFWIWQCVLEILFGKGDSDSIKEQETLGIYLSEPICIFDELEILLNF
jgi:hypothetical protein